MSEFEMALQAGSRGSNKPDTIAAQTAVGRYSQEVQGMVFMAKQFPRDQYAAWGKIKEACQRKSLAEIAAYEYPRGGEKISGPSIRLAEVLALNWGNMSHGVVELEQKSGESVAMAFAWDLETNTRSELIFTVKHERKARGKINKLTDPRDIYELVANYGARRKRACILAVIPKDVIDSAVDECEKTLAGGSGEPIADRIKKMLDKFKEMGVTKDMIETRAGYTVDRFTERDIVGLQKVFNAIKDDMASRDDYFKAQRPEPPKSDTDLEEEFHKEQEKKAGGKAGQMNLGGDDSDGVK